MHSSFNLSMVDCTKNLWKRALLKCTKLSSWLQIQLKRENTGACLSACLSACLPVCLSACLPVCLSAYAYAYAFIISTCCWIATWCDGEMNDKSSLCLTLVLLYCSLWLCLVCVVFFLRSLCAKPMDWREHSCFIRNLPRNVDVKRRVPGVRQVSIAMGLYCVAFHSFFMFFLLQLCRSLVERKCP